MFVFENNTKCIKSLAEFVLPIETTFSENKSMQIFMDIEKELKTYMYETIATDEQLQLLEKNLTKMFAYLDDKATIIGQLECVKKIQKINKSLNEQLSHNEFETFSLSINRLQPSRIKADLKEKLQKYSVDLNASLEVEMVDLSSSVTFSFVEEMTGIQFVQLMYNTLQKHVSVLLVEYCVKEMIVKQKDFEHLNQATEWCKNRIHQIEETVGHLHYVSCVQEIEVILNKIPLPMYRNETPLVKTYIHEKVLQSKITCSRNYSSLLQFIALAIHQLATSTKDFKHAVVPHEEMLLQKSAQLYIERNFLHSTQTLTIV